ncbi:MAG: hypothetical protein IJG34_09390 [Synergistaceae bacterium]|nr:hypothetical protein [Synergistaceae bacterium]MBQ3693800.1 hypothetical protein [Synergistaceae bacterium]MBQ6112312.1 hypothetical protein [Synergistaceae bacterium]MBR0069649.1 hypothetical protein [Synergistaceae bacterium]MBR0250810.1 hypothetical protein [Synergistaceae bacterium]
MSRSRKRKILQKIQRLLYFSLLTFIFMIGYRVYQSWYENYKFAHPQIIEAITTNYNEEQPLEGILLWDEQLIYAPNDGILTYPSPRPRMTSKGEMLAALDGRAVYAPYPAYFYPGLDGNEGSWVYPKLWPDFAPFPEFNNASLIENGTYLHRGDPIGKLVPQPQVLRCIAYLDRTPSLERALRNKDNPTIRIKTENEGKERKADVVAAKVSGQKIKVYLRLPFFPPNVLRSREFKASVVTAVEQGVMVPDTAVITKEGKNMVYVVQGNSPTLQAIEGFPADDKNFFIEKGIKHGSKLILNADTLNSVNKDSSAERIW